mgnify:CR=1 FL=1
MHTGARKKRGAHAYPLGMHPHECARGSHAGRTPHETGTTTHAWVVQLGWSDPE